MKLSDIKLAIYKWVDSQGEKAIWSNQNAPIPKGNYVMLQLNNFISLIDMYELPPNSLGISRLVGHGEVTLTIQVFGSNGLDRLQNLRISLAKRSVRDLISNEGIAFIDVENISDLTGLVSQEYEPRAQIDIRLRFPVETTDDVGIIETVSGHGSVDYILPSEQPPEQDWDIELTINAAHNLQE